ncbi:Teichoic acids export ATP-binding protein TagH [Lawsonella clevelandensis]|uniref:Teichoic acids export ATP-binding protein TagH n=1 Tax=Lawsonella clevelandensis TaxID=1528099 RepID=A0A5E3ZX91_9ACTN|nr:Teichoic acids export ATP-binding protein TagH [Lawsonella clevelandensis]
MSHKENRAEAAAARAAERAARRAARVSLSDRLHRPAPRTTDVSIDTYDACVDFPIFDARTRSLKQTFLGAAGGAIGRNSSNVVVVEALKNINLHLREGDRVGLVGHNGAGKSTLLRLLSGIYEPTRGSAEVHGRVAPVFDLGIGMDPEISGYENIIIRGLFLGQTRQQMKEKMEEIAEFTELGEYLDMPLRTYSSGMRIRLALGVVTSIDPEILLLDEGLGAVDAAFMRKARHRLKDMVQRSGLLVFASHSNEFLAQLCDKAIWIDHGEAVLAGSVEEVVRAYEGNEAGDHVANIIAQMEREDRERGIDSRRLIVPHGIEQPGDDDSAAAGTDAGAAGEPGEGA